MLTASRDIRLLLTGFQGWGDIKINPSELIGQQLDGAVLQLKGQPDSTDAPASSISATNSALPLEVSPSSTRAILTFKPVRVSYREIEKLVPQFHDSGEWDCIVHVGLAKGYEACTIETGSKSLGYSLKDVDGELAPEVGLSRGVEGTKSRWDCTMDCRECCDELNGMGYKVPEPKEDDPTAPYTLSELTEIVRALCNFTARQAVAVKA
ncbi:hypothetical protein QFC21_004331 [Naganishia friedmannii]|uniref:Uncharacterized protein n=1 Tax=Naganishia friedmannii TaxID=89922 RepID=A0ACC2VHS6_9TREE|nr:hypothetical protein QFC21_004331 [Naganishia friedmannii]